MQCHYVLVEEVYYSDYLNNNTKYIDSSTTTRYGTPLDLTMMESTTRSQGWVYLGMSAIMPTNIPYGNIPHRTTWVPQDMIMKTYKMNMETLGKNKF